MKTATLLVGITLIQTAKLIQSFTVLRDEGASSTTSITLSSLDRRRRRCHDATPIKRQWQEEEQFLLFPLKMSSPRLTDDGWDFAKSDKRYVVAAGGGSEAWLQNILTIPQSRILSRISNHLGATTLWACWIAAAFAAANQSQLLPPQLQGIIRTCALPELPHGIAGSLITLLLAFRTSQAYERFWEGRRLWDGIYGETRGLARLLTLCEPGVGANPNMGVAPPEWRKQRDVIVAVLAAFPYALKQHLRGEMDKEELFNAAGTSIGNVDLQREGSKGEMGEVYRVLNRALRSSNVPLDLLKALSRLIRPMRSEGELLWWQMDSHIGVLTSILGKCERIKGTPVPLSYSRHTSRFFSVYCFTLPFALNGFEDYWLLPVAVAVVSWFFFATEEIGHIIEDPFGHGVGEEELWDSNISSDPQSPQLEVLPLGRYCAEIAADVASLARREMDESEMPGYEDENLVLFDEEPA